MSIVAPVLSADINKRDVYLPAGKWVKAESGELFVTKIYVDGGATLKRMRPAPQGRGYRIRKRSNHVTLFVDSKSTNDNQN